MNKVYVVIKDEVVEKVEFERSVALELAKQLAGVEAGISLADVSVWEAEAGGKPTMIYSVSWEATGPLEPLIFVGSPSISPQS